MIGSVLVANRGEIAVRLIRAYRGLGVRAIAVYSDADAAALHVRLAGEAVRLGPAPVTASYLNQDAVIAAARTAGAQAVDPGYGLLSENAEFAAAVAGAGLVFVGPPASVIAAMGDKLAARAVARRAGVPVVPGSGEITSPDRDCSVQRRHQKLIEEAPAPFLPERVRAGMREAAARLAAAAGYRSTGTAEFLYSPASGEFWFLEMNTRLQVEHGVTELVTGLDLAELRLAVAAGAPLGLTQDDVRIGGHAIEARLAAEDPWRQFLPVPGTLTGLHVPAGPWLRADFGVAAGGQVPAEYDSLFGKLMAWGPDRGTARRRLAAALGELQVSGLPSTAPYLRDVLLRPDFADGTYSTATLEERWQPRPDARPGPGPRSRARPAGRQPAGGRRGYRTHGARPGEHGDVRYQDLRPAWSGPGCRPGGPRRRSPGRPAVPGRRGTAGRPDGRRGRQGRGGAGGRGWAGTRSWSSWRR